ncbi:phage stabilization protein [Caudoviricetes sp.]|nr:phage stabilization protein [Caudoviricetes sp.]
MPLTVPAFDLTFHAIGTKVLYVDHNNSDAVVDTGITLTNGTESTFEEHNGMVFVTNATDGCYAFLLTRLNGSVTGGAATITTDVEGGAMANVLDTELSPGTKNLRVNGTNEQYSAVSASTGVFTLSGTASQSYADNTIAMVVYDLTARFPKCDKIVAWKESLNFIGLSENTGNALSSDRRQTTLAFTQFATAIASENIVKVSGGTSGTELVGKSGKLVNAIQTRDYLYLFKETATYYISVGDVVVASGARPPQVLSENYGCLNKYSAADMGNGQVVFLTKNNRIIRIKIDSQTGAAVVFPDESFDQAYSNTLKLMDADQTGALVYYAAAEKRLFVQITVDSNKLTLPWNNETQSWEPPRNGWFFAGYYEREGTLYGTDTTDDTIYELSTTSDDDGLAIECVMATPKVQFADGRVTCRWEELEFSGSMTENTEIQLQSIVNGGTPQTKTFDASGINFALAPSLGSLIMGTTTLSDGVLASSMGEFDKRCAIYPSVGADLQIILSTSGEGQSFAWSSYSVRAKSYSKSHLTLI